MVPSARPTMTCSTGPIHSKNLLSITTPLCFTKDFPSLLICPSLPRKYAILSRGNLYRKTPSSSATDARFSPSQASMKMPPMIYKKGRSVLVECSPYSAYDAANQYALFRLEFRDLPLAKACKLFAKISCQPSSATAHSNSRPTAHHVIRSQDTVGPAGSSAHVNRARSCLSIRLRGG